jgi:hypothetical protein
MPRLPSKTKETVARLIRRRLRELDRTPEMLATAVQVPAWYVDELLSGSRLPPAPDRTDIYDKITRYLRLHRNELAERAEAQRAEVVQTRRRPVPRVRELILELCDPTKLRALGRHLTGREGPELERLIAERILSVAKSFVGRQLEDEVGVRAAAKREGVEYLDMRIRMLDFLDARADTLTPAHHAHFVRPRIATWDIDVKTRAMRIVLRSQEPRPGQKRALNF